jgi:surfactin synthase thioesterase subunit
VDPLFLSSVLPTVRGDYQAFETYHLEGGEGGETLACPIVCFSARGDVSVSRDSMLGWAETTSGCFSVVELDGSHFYLIEGEGGHKEMFQRKLTEELLLTRNEPVLDPDEEEWY